MSNPTMTERVADAIYREFENRPRYARSQMNGLLAADLARVAIEAMREPTPAMEAAGEFPTRRIDLGNGTTAEGLGFGASAVSSYVRMIDAALAEEQR